MMAILQILVNGIILFFLYRFFIKTIGAEQFGIWALVMAFTSFASVANLGFAGSVVKFVAQSQANDDKERTSLIIQTSAISIAVISGALMMFLFPVVSWSMKYFVGSSSLPMAILLLPYSFAALWLMMIGGIFLSALDGYKRTDIRGLIMIGVSASNLTLCVLLVPKFGLIGVAYSIICSNCLALMSGWVMIKRSNPQLPFLPFIWRKNIFKEIIGYATKFQIVTLAVMFFEPVTKALLSKFGGLSIVAYYEMASRLVLQLRALIVSAYHVLIPVFSEYREKSLAEIPKIYLKSYELIYYLALPVFGLLIIWLVPISDVWIGYTESTFIAIANILATIWCFNTLAAPAYTASLGLGELKWNLAGHILTAVLNVMFGYVGGLMWGALGVLVGASVALITGSILISVPFHFNSGLKLRSYFPKEGRYLTGCLLIALLINQLAMSNYLMITGHYMNIYIPIILTLAIVLLAVVHPMRRHLQEWLKASISK